MQTDDQVAPPRVVGWTIPDSAVAVDAPEEVWQLEAVPLPGPVAPLWGGGNAVAHQGGEGSDEEYACDEDDFDEDDDEGAQKPVLEPDPYPEPVKGPESAGARPVTPDGKSPQPHMAGRPSQRRLSNCWKMCLIPICALRAFLRALSERDENPKPKPPNPKPKWLTVVTVSLLLLLCTHL